MTGPETESRKRMTHSEISQSRTECDYRGDEVLQSRDRTYSCYLCKAKKLTERCDDKNPCQQGNGTSFVPYGPGLCRIENPLYTSKA